MVEPWHIGLQIEFIIGIILSLAAGFVIGAERESRGKPAGISTNSLVIGGSMMFAYISSVIDPNFTHSSSDSKWNWISGSRDDS